MRAHSSESTSFVRKLPHDVAFEKGRCAAKASANRIPCGDGSSMIVSVAIRVCNGRAYVEQVLVRVQMALIGKKIIVFDDGSNDEPHTAASCRMVMARAASITRQRRVDEGAGRPRRRRSELRHWCRSLPPGRFPRRAAAARRN